MKAEMPGADDIKVRPIRAMAIHKLAGLERGRVRSTLR
jgi:hypothetical protein